MYFQFNVPNLSFSGHNFSSRESTHGLTLISCLLDWVTYIWFFCRIPENTAHQYSAGYRIFMKISRLKKNKTGYPKSDVGYPALFTHLKSRAGTWSWECYPLAAGPWSGSGAGSPPPGILGAAPRWPGWSAGSPAPSWPAAPPCATYILIQRFLEKFWIK